MSNLAPLLSTATIIAIPAIAKFSVEDNFQEVRENLPKISVVADNIKEWFYGFTEEPADEFELRISRLNRPSKGEIYEAAGGPRLAITSMATIYHLISKQPNGEGGNLLTNGTNIFLVTGKDGCWPHFVFITWNRRGWMVHGEDHFSSDYWTDGDQFYSRNS